MMADSGLPWEQKRDASSVCFLSGLAVVVLARAGGYLQFPSRNRRTLQSHQRTSPLQILWSLDGFSPSSFSFPRSRGVNSGRNPH